RLAAELASPGPATPQWSDLQWQLARAVAAIHGVSPLLRSRLRWQGPTGWQEFLEAQREHVFQRYTLLAALLEAIDAGARREGIPLVALKGAALHALGLYIPGERPMADIDLLARRADYPRAAALLETLGYRHAFSNWKHGVFTPESKRAFDGVGEH